jgi:hypothetical protein
MIVAADGSKFYVYLEGVRIPVLRIQTTNSKMVSQASIDVYAHESAKGIKDGTMIAIFYTKSGLKHRRLLYSGFLTSRTYTKRNGLHTLSLNFESRMGYTNRLRVSSVNNGPTSGMQYAKAADPNKAPANSQNPDYYADGTQINDNAAREASFNSGNLNFTKTTATELAENTIGGVPVNTGAIWDKIKDMFTGGHTTGRGAEDQSMDERDLYQPVQKRQFRPYLGGYVMPVKSFLDKVFKVVFTDTSDFNRRVYDTRFRMEKYLDELPGGLGEYIFGDSSLLGDGDVDIEGPEGKPGARTMSLSRYNNTIEKFIDKLGGNASMADVVHMAHAMLMMEGYEIPGYLDGAFHIVPESIFSDIPMCNVIFPDMCTSISYYEDSNNKITRLIYAGSPQAGRSDLAKNKGAVKTSYNIGMYPKAYDIITQSTDKALENKYHGILFDTEVYNGPIVSFTNFPAAYLGYNKAKLLNILAEYHYRDASSAYRRCDVQTHFYPEAITGIRAVVNDGIWQGVGKIDSTTHVITPNQAPITNIRLTNYQKLEEYEYEVPSWYNKDYKPEVISALYEDKYGCKSVGGFLNQPGTELKTLIDELSAKYETATLKAHMAEVLTARRFMTQEEYFDAYGCDDIQQDGEGVLIYQGVVFNAYEYGSAYTVDGKEGSVIADSQTPVIEYRKAIYGRPAVKV